VRRARLLIAVLAGAVFALGVGASGARPAAADHVTISMLFNGTFKPGWSVLIANFEHAYPNITVNITYGSIGDVSQLEATELTAGTAPDLLLLLPGCGGILTACELARAGDLAPMIDKPWVRRSMPAVTSLDKHDDALYAFEPLVTPHGIFTNDSLFAKLGLKVPQTFSQLLAVCKQTQTDGIVAMELGATSPTTLGDMILGLVTPLVYGQGTHWTAALKAGTVSFDGTAGWHQALQELVEMNTAGCFQPGVAGDTAPVAFEQGQALMTVGPSAHKGTIDAGNPQFSYTFHPFPATTAPGQTTTFLRPTPAVAVNAHSSAQNQAAAQTFVDFIARPAQNALYARLTGGLTQYEFLKDQIPAFMSDYATIFKNHHYVLEPDLTWWNPDVGVVFRTDAIGLLTGQETPASILQAMDAAWKQGPA
jgi:raffinose/stachyose/melibiose transport system substrate-binding protein